MSLSDLYEMSTAQTSAEDHRNPPDHEQKPGHQQLIQEATILSNTYPNESPVTNPTEALVSQPPLNDVGTRTKNDNRKLKRGTKANRSIKPENSTTTRFKWTKEMMQVALNLLKYGCKPKIVSVAVGCSIRTAQKFAETVSPREEGQSYREYQLRRRGRKLKDTNSRLEAIREVLNKDCTKTQVEIAANLKVSNTTVCRDLKKLGGLWRDKKVRQNSYNGEDNTIE